jgi:hypothetical protein
LIWKLFSFNMVKIQIWRLILVVAILGSVWILVFYSVSICYICVKSNTKSLDWEIILVVVNPSELYFAPPSNIWNKFDSYISL